MRVLMCVVVFVSAATATVGAPLQAAETATSSTIVAPPSVFTGSLENPSPEDAITLCVLFLHTVPNQRKGGFFGRTTLTPNSSAL